MIVEFVYDWVYVLFDVEELVIVGVCDIFVYVVILINVYFIFIVCMIFCWLKYKIVLLVFV